MQAMNTLSFLCVVRHSEKVEVFPNHGVTIVCLHHKFISISISIPINRYAVKAMALGNQTSLDADLQIAADANKPIPSPVEDADWDDVIVIPSNDDEANVNEPIPLPVEDADVEIAPHHNPFFNPKLLNWNWDDVIIRDHHNNREPKFMFCPRSS
nr:hypothetical protein [Tanacetum cinerariifolium]